MKKDDLIRRIVESRNALAGFWQNLAEEKIDVVVDLQSGWNVKTLIAHLTFWERVTLDCHAGRASAESLRDVDAINASLLFDTRSRTVSDVLSEFSESGKSIIEEINALGDEELLNASPWKDGKPLWEHLADDTFIHYEEHTPKLHRWIANLS